MSTKTRTYKRSELYDQVWAEPMRRLAPRYGVSDVALAKMCRRLGVPLPGVGHWTKIACGHQIERPPLPPATSEQPEEVVVEQPEPRVHPPAVVAAQIPELKVADQLRSPHPLVAKTKQLAANARADFDGRYQVRRQGGLDTLVGPQSLGRALRIFDAILKYLEGLGYQVAVGRERPFSTHVTIRGQNVAFQLREAMTRTPRLATVKDPFPYPPFDYHSTRSFTLEIKEYFDGGRKVWRDGKVRPLELQLGEFIVGLEYAATYLQNRQEEFLAAEREREAWRIRQAELETRRREEQRRIDELMNEVSSWQKSRTLRSFVASARDAAIAKYGTIEEGSELDNWIKWALGVADRFDPLEKFEAGASD